MNSFNRVGEITIGKPGQQGIVINNLNFAFKVKKTITPEMNPGTVMIYNLARETSAAMHEFEAVCILKVGYSEAEGPIEVYRGYVSKSIGGNAGPDYITTLELRDGYQEITSSKFAKSYSKHTNMSTIVNDIIKSLGLPEAVQNKLSNIAKTKLKRGISFNGYSTDVLNEVSNVAGIEWSVQSGKLKVLEKGRSDNTQAVYISPNTGLIRSPERLTDIVVGKDSRGKDKKQVGWRLDTTLFPKVEPGNSVKLDSKLVSGDFKVMSIEHSGELLGSEFISTLEVVEL